MSNSAKIGLANSEFEMEIVDDLFQISSRGVGYAIPLEKFRKALRQATDVLLEYDHRPTNVREFKRRKPPTS